MALEHIETKTVSSQSQIDFTNVFDGSADRYILYVDSVKTDSADAFLSARFSSDGGSTFDSGSSDYSSSTHFSLDDGSSISRGYNSDKIDQLIPDSFGSTSLDTCHGKVIFHHPEDVNRGTVVSGAGATYRGSLTDAFRTGFSGGERLAQSAIDSFRLFDSFNGASFNGTLSLYAVTESSAGAKEHIETIEANSQSSVDFTNVFASDDGYDRYEIHADNVIPTGTDTASTLQTRFSSDGGSTWDSGSSDYSFSRFGSGDGGFNSGAGSSGSSEIVLSRFSYGTDPADNDTSEHNMVISEPTNSNRATVLRNDSAGRNNSSGGDKFTMGYAGGIRLTQSAIDSIQFFMDSGDISSGTFSVYGIGKG